MMVVGDDELKSPAHRTSAAAVTCEVPSARDDEDRALLDATMDACAAHACGLSTGKAAPTRDAGHLVLGAEIAYRAADAEALAACIPRRLADGGTAVLCSDEKRAPLKLCGELLRTRGFVVDDSVLTLTVTPDGDTAATHRVRVVRARRSSSSSSSVGAS